MTFTKSQSVFQGQVEHIVLFHVEQLIVVIKYRTTIYALIFVKLFQLNELRKFYYFARNETLTINICVLHILRIFVVVILKISK